MESQANQIKPEAAAGETSRGLRVAKSHDVPQRSDTEVGAAKSPFACRMRFLMTVRLQTITCACAVAAVIAAAHAHGDQPTTDEIKFFETKIRPVLIKECYGCHSNKAGNVRGGLRLDTRELTRMGGSSGPAVVPGDLDQSLLISAINHVDFEMPPQRKLSASVIADFRSWVEMGAPDPRTTKVAAIKPTISDADIESARLGFWSFQRPVVQVPPAAKNTDWAITEIDRFVLAGLERAGLRPAADAESYQVLRRLCFDLVGLPPSSDQREWFIDRWQDDPDRAVAELIDRLLRTEQFGERWGTPLVGCRPVCRVDGPRGQHDLPARLAVS